MASVYRKGLDCPRQLTEEERTRFEAMMVLAFNSQENFFLLREMGLINDTLWAGGRAAYYRFLLRHDEPNRWWERSRRMFSAAFADYVEGFRSTDANAQGDKPDRPSPEPGVLGRQSWRESEKEQTIAALRPTPYDCRSFDRVRGIREPSYPAWAS